MKKFTRVEVEPNVFQLFVDGEPIPQLKLSAIEYGTMVDTLQKTHGIDEAMIESNFDFVIEAQLIRLDQFTPEEIAEAKRVFLYDRS